MLPINLVTGETDPFLERWIDGFNERQLKKKWRVGSPSSH